MLRIIKSISFALLLVGVIGACAAPAISAPVSTQPADTAIPHILDDQITIPVGEGGDETIKATITGNGDIAVMVHKHRYDTDTKSYWTPLVDSLSANEKLRIITYTLRGYETGVRDTRIVFDYLKAEGVTKIICISAGIGQVCTNLQDEPEIIGMVKFPGDILTPIEADFPKLFVASEADSDSLRQTYENSAEPKTFKSYAVSADGPAIFSVPDVGLQVVADITDFINGIVNSQ